MRGQEQDSKLKEKDYAEWIEGQTLDALQEELGRLDSRRRALEQDQEELEEPESSVSAWSQLERIRKERAEVTHQIYAVHRELTARRTKALVGSRPEGAAPVGEPEVAKRRAIVRQNPQTSARGLCTLFDEEHVPLPRGWVAENWEKAYLSNLDLRAKIDTIISKDRKMIRH